MLFPEGHRQAPGAEPDYKPGVAALYRDLDLPCLPVATNSGVHWPAHGIIRRPGVIVFSGKAPVLLGKYFGRLGAPVTLRVDAHGREWKAVVGYGYRASLD